MSRAEMFYDVHKRQECPVAYSNFVALEKVQTISFKNTDEMCVALKDFLEQGVCTVDNYSNSAKVGVIFCGNVSKTVMDMDRAANMFDELSTVFHESVRIERFQGLIKAGTFRA